MTYDDDTQPPCAPLAGWDVLLRGYVVRPPKVKMSRAKKVNPSAIYTSQLRKARLTRLAKNQNRVLEYLQDGKIRSVTVMARDLHLGTEYLGRLMGGLYRRSLVMQVAGYRKMWMKK